jgi:hypothetical protein
MYCKLEFLARALTWSFYQETSPSSPRLAVVVLVQLYSRNWCTVCVPAPRAYNCRGGLVTGTTINKTGSTH